MIIKKSHSRRTKHIQWYVYKKIQFQHKYILGNAYICYFIKQEQRNEHMTKYSRVDPLFIYIIARSNKDLVNQMKIANIPVYGNNAVYIKILRCLSKNRLYTKMLRIHLFSIFTIKTPRALPALAPLGLLIVKSMTSVL